MEAVRPPSGNVTFLFTDIEGSTRRWDKDRQAMQEAVRRHDRILRAAITGQRGHVFKTIGDAFCAAFDSVDSAVEAALVAQRTLDAADFAAVGGIRVRMALHTGTADERDGDYFGPTLNRVARLLSIGHGGQVLLSRVTAELLGDVPPAAMSLMNLGSHVLRDLTEPEEVYQLIAPGIERTFPELRSVRTSTDNLPAEATSFVGRASQTSELVGLLANHRMVTVVGPGGIGKTRLTLRVAEMEREASAGGVWFVELAATVDAALLPRLIASAIGHALPDGDALAGLTSAIGKKPMLLVLDNCEHLLEAVAQVASAILGSCPNVRILASSRQALGIGGETVMKISPLDVPTAGSADTISAARALSYDAVALFVERARGANTRFELTSANVPAVTEICRRLDGIPLALELAAARLRVIGPEQLQKMLDHRFRLLVGGKRDAASRQQTLQAAIGWSYDLLDERERTVFRRCGTFVDGFTPSGATAVVGVAHLEEHDLFEILYSLAEKSLIVADINADETRFRFLESMRAYAGERMDETGEREAAATRHLEYLCALAERAQSEFMRTGSDAAFTRTLASEINDVRAALAFAVSRGLLVSGASLLAAVGRPWFRLGLMAEGIQHIETFVAMLPPSNAHLLARLWTELGWMASSTFHSARGYEASVEAVRWARVANDPPTLAWTLAYFAGVAGRSRKFAEAEAALKEAEALRGPNPSPGQRFTELEIRAALAFLQKDFESAALAFAAHLLLLRSIGDEAGATTTAGSYAEVEHARGNTRHAIQLVCEMLPAAQRLIGTEQYALILNNLAAYHLALGEIADARVALSESISLLAPADPASATVTIALELEALALALDGMMERAARIEGYCESAFRKIGFQRETTEETTHNRLMKLLREQIASADLDAFLAEGESMRPQDALAAAGGRAAAASL